MKKIALVVGHTKDSPGACNNTYNICEWDFNDKLVKHIHSLINRCCDSTIVYRDTYKALPGKVNKLNPDFVICFHANAFNSRVTGCETLYYHKSKKGKEIAEIFQGNLVKRLNLNDRGSKSKATEDRGGYMLRYVDAPCIILEPFFIDNDAECEKMGREWKELANVCSDSICEIVKIV